MAVFGILALQKDRLIPSNHLNIHRLQLGCADACETRIWYSKGNRRFDHYDNVKVAKTIWNEISHTKHTAQTIMNTGLYVGKYVLQLIVLFSGQVMHLERPVTAQGVETSAQPLIKTHWGRDKTDIISQMTFSSTFSWTKMFQFQFKVCSYGSN